MSDTRIVDPDAIEWLVKEGGEVTKETILAMTAEIRWRREDYASLRNKGCGYRACGMARSGFSEDED